MNACIKTFVPGRVFAASALLVATAIASVPALAAPQSDTVTVTVTVRLGDLDLLSRSGATLAFIRLRDAADTVCGDDRYARRELYGMQALRNCEQQALEPAVEQLNVQPLTAIFNRHFPSHPASINLEPVAG